MRRRIVWSGVVCLGVGAVALVVASGIGTEATVGTGFLDVGDLRAASGQGYLVGKGVEMRGRLALHSNGCVTVVVDGVERMPLWPEGTKVFQDPGNLARYLVDLPGDVTLNVDNVSADAFSAAGIIGKDDATAGSQAEMLPEKVASFIAYCGIEAAPVAFPDATTFAIRATS